MVKKTIPNIKNSMISADNIAIGLLSIKKPSNIFLITKAANKKYKPIWILEYPFNEKFN